jgi:tetratricopeptide (TPR) repeat protein
MNKFSSACSAALLLLLCGCATEVQRVPLTGNIMVDGPSAIAKGPPRDKVLWQYRLAAADLRSGHYQEAKSLLDDALLTLGGIYGRDKNARRARGYFHEEAKKTFIGEPYERVMAYYYRGILYWMDGEPDNARACFRTAQLEDANSEDQQFASDYVLLDYLDGLASTKLAGDGSDAFKRAEKSSKRTAKPPPYNAAANVLFFLEFGPGPTKYGAGEYGEELHFRVTQSPVQSAVINVAGQSIKVGHYDDLGFQATTRGGRVMDHVLANKAVFKTATGAAGDAALFSGLAVAASAGRHDQTAAEVGLGLAAAGLISKLVSAGTTPKADTRTWDNLPHYLSFAAVQLPPGLHTATVQFLDRGGQPMANLTKTITINVPADKLDKVVFVSDTSLTPLTL